MSTPYQKVQPHFPDLTMKEVECLIGDTWDFYNNRAFLDASQLASAYLSDMAQTPNRLECYLWPEEKWLQEIARMQAAKRQ